MSKYKVTIPNFPGSISSTVTIEYIDPKSGENMIVNSPFSPREKSKTEDIEAKVTSPGYAERTISAVTNITTSHTDRVRRERDEIESQEKKSCCIVQ